MSLSLFPVLTVLVVLLVSAGCSNESGPDYVPALEDGLKREYAYRFTAPGDPPRDGTMRYEIGGQEEIAGKTWFEETTALESDTGIPPVRRFVRDARKGRYAIDGQDPSKTEYLEIPYPVTAGRKWVVESPAMGRIECHAEGVETLTWGGREIECLKVTHTDVNGKGHYYLAPGIGKVKIVSEMGQARMEYTLAPPE